MARFLATHFNVFFHRDDAASHWTCFTSHKSVFTFAFSLLQKGCDAFVVSGCCLGINGHLMGMPLAFADLPTIYR
jgi:hypothetical protein